MEKSYSRINWENYPSDATPINETNLNKIDYAVNEIDNRVIELDTTKTPMSTAYTMVKDITFAESTGIFTVKYLNGATYTLDTKLEKVTTNWTFDESTQKLVLTLVDGTKQYVDLSALITQNEFVDTDTVGFTVDSSGTVTAIVKEGSIEEKHLRPEYLADIRVESAAAAQSVKDAELAANSSESFSTLAKTYYENTMTLSISNVGDVKFSIDAEKKCLVAQYMGGSEEVLSDDWYTAFVKQVSEYLTTTESNALASSSSATAAATSATESANSATEASTYATAANVSEANAASSATAASTSLTDVKSYVSQAKTYYENTQTLSISNVGDITFSLDAEKKCLIAKYMEDGEETLSDDWYSTFISAMEENLATVKTSATTASNAATEAASSASSAKTYASNASTSASNAATSATTASNASTSAASSATAAANSATTASTAATTATTKASEASTSANTASTKATAAATSATNAATSESNAKTSATSAATSATSASTSATNAATSESNAKTYAATATDKATAAASSASDAAASAASAQTYYEQTKQLSIANVGDITFSIDEAKNCLCATYTES